MLASRVTSQMCAHSVMGDQLHPEKQAAFDSMHCDIKMFQNRGTN